LIDISSVFKWVAQVIEAFYHHVVLYWEVYRFVVYALLVFVVFKRQIIRQISLWKYLCLIRGLYPYYVSKQYFKYAHFDDSHTSVSTSIIYTPLDRGRFLMLGYTPKLLTDFDTQKKAHPYPTVGTPGYIQSTQLALDADTLPDQEIPYFKKEVVSLRKELSETIESIEVRERFCNLEFHEEYFPGASAARDIYRIPILDIPWRLTKKETVSAVFHFYAKPFVFPKDKDGGIFDYCTVWHLLPGNNEIEIQVMLRDDQTFRDLENPECEIAMRPVLCVEKLEKSGRWTVPRLFMAKKMPRIDPRQSFAGTNYEMILPWHTPPDLGGYLKSNPRARPFHDIDNCGKEIKNEMLEVRLHRLPRIIPKNHVTTGGSLLIYYGWQILIRWRAYPSKTDVPKLFS